MLRNTPGFALCAMLFLTAVAVAPEGLAQPPRMVQDVRTEPLNDLPWLTGPHDFVRLGDHLYFGADDGLQGFELWRTDGTTAGTEMVADVCPGQCNGVAFGVGTAAGGLVYFAADDGVHDMELWASDGTAAGTRMVRDIHPVRFAWPRWFTPLGDRVAFTALDPEHGRELWISDGTEQGTVLLDDLVPGPEGSEPAALLAAGGTLFFNAWDPAHGREPWASDGTPGGAVRLGDLRPGAEGSITEEVDFPPAPRHAAVLDGLYVFRADDGVNQRQIWVSDGSPAGTVRISDVGPTGFSTGVSEIVSSESFVYFAAYDDVEGGELWRTDGTPGGTQRVTDIRSGPDFNVPRGVTPVGPRVFFSDDTDATGEELWVTDDTADGAHLVADLFPGADGSTQWSLFWTGGWALDSQRLLFFADDGVHGMEPWVSDGTLPGTFLLRDIAEDDLASHFAQFAPFSPPAPIAGGLAFFAWQPETGYELWWTDGSRAGTGLLRDFDQQASSLFDVAQFPVADLAGVGGRLFFQAVDDTHGLELWISGGTPGTTRLVADIETGGNAGSPGGSMPFSFVPLEDTLVFQTQVSQLGGASSGEAWRSDGTEPGTFGLVTGGDNHGFSKAAGVAFFTGDAGFWASDGTPAGTRLMTGVEAGLEAGELAGGVLFSGTTAETGQELFRLDDGLTGASLVADVVPGPASSHPSALTPLGDLLLFAATTPAAGRELWVSDGSDENTRLLADVRPGEGSSIRNVFRRAYGGLDLQPIVASGPRAYVAADDGVHGMEPWVSDGTPAGTRLLADLHPGPLGSNPVWMTDVDGRIYFVADDGTTGAELWTSDGTSAGTRRVADLAPGPASSSPRFLVDVDGVLHFAAFTPAAGVELWRLDAAGEPEPVAEIVPGPGSSSPSYLTVAGRRLFFFATDGVHGYEPWSMVLPSRKLHASLSSRREGTTVFLDVVLTNPTPVDQPDAAGDELVLPLPAALTPVAVEATGGEAEIVAAGGLGSGGAAAATTGHTLLWNGALPAGASETISLELTLATGLATPVELQAELFFDTDADGANDLSVPSDDPRLAGAADPTVITAPQVLEVPGLRLPGTVLLALLLVVGALWRLRSG